MKKIVRGLADSFDHTFLYEKGSLKAATISALADEGFSLTELSYRPTAENLARDFFIKLRETGLPVKSVTVYETPENCAIYEEEK